MLILTKSIFALMIGFLTAVVLGLILVPALRKLKVRQRISVFVGDNHKKKEGTPTMGGLIFILSTLITIGVLLLTGKIEYTNNLGIVLIIFVGN